MIVSPRRLILAITLAPPVIKIKQQGGSVQFLTFMSHCRLVVQTLASEQIQGWLVWPLPGLLVLMWTGEKLDQWRTINAWGGFTVLSIENFK